MNLHGALRSRFTGEIHAPLPRHCFRRTNDIQSFGIVLEPRYIVGAGLLD